MKPIHEWELSTDAFMLQDLIDASCLKRGPRDPRFADAVFRLLRHRVIDPGVTDTDLGHLSMEEVAVLGKRLLECIVEQMHMEQAMPSLRKMVNDVHAESRSGPDGYSGNQ